MIKRKNVKPKIKPYFHNENITVSYEYQFKNHLMKPGDLFKARYQRGSFKFIKVVNNAEKNVTWIDCLDGKSGEFRSFYTDNIKSVVLPPKPRKKRKNV